MELTHLRYFIAVAEELHFGRAAAKLHMAQPPLSQQIKRLEDELNIKLFHRTSRRVALSVAGKIFLREAREIVERAKKICATMASLSQGQSGYLSVSFNESAINTFLPDVIKQFMRKYPEVKLATDGLPVMEHLNGLDEKRIDLAFTNTFGFDIKSYSKRLVLREQYILALPTDHKLCAYSAVTLDMLRDESLILFARTDRPLLRERFEECFQLAGFKPNIVQQLKSQNTTLAMVKSGLGLSIVPESSMCYGRVGVEFRKLDSDLPPVEIFALWCPENDSPLIQNFLDLIPLQA